MTSIDEYAGVLVAVEGPDGAGKTTLADGLAVRLEVAFGGPVVCVGQMQSEVGAAVRRAVTLGQSAACKALLFAADRILTLEETVLGALRAQQIVLWDRYVLTGDIYRQADIELSLSGGADNGHAERLLNLLDACRMLFPEPDCTLILNLPVDIAADRMTQRGRISTHSRQYLAAISSSYQAHEGRNIYHIDATQSVGAVQESAFECVYPIVFGKLGLS